MADLIRPESLIGLKLKGFVPFHVFSCWFSELIWYQLNWGNLDLAYKWSVSISLWNYFKIASDKTHLWAQADIQRNSTAKFTDFKSSWILKFTSCYLSFRQINTVWQTGFLHKTDGDFQTFLHSLRQVWSALTESQTKKTWKT